MNVSFFQTYGDRLPLLNARKEDTHFQNFIKNFDLNIISLHNPTENVKQFVKTNKILNKSIMFVFNGNKYCDCICHLIKFLKQKPLNKFFFYQDDTFSKEVNEKNIKDLINIVFNTTYEMINLSYKINYLVDEKKNWSKENKNILYKGDWFNLYDTNTFDFKDSGLWAFDDSCFVCSSQMLDVIFDENYFQNPDIWCGENYLNNKFKNNKINRYITDISFFSNYNILGPNRHPKGIEMLKENVQISKNTLQLLEEYYNNSK